MMRNVSLKAKMISAGVLAGLALAVLTVVDIYSVEHSVDSLSDVYEHRVEPVTAIQAMDRDLNEVRFRMAGVLLDQLPAVGSLNQLKEVNTDLPKQWAVFKERTNQNAATPETKELLAKIERQLPAFLSFSEKLANAYSSSDKKAITSMLEDEWPAVQSGLVKPLEQLIPQQQAAIKDTYEASRRAGTKLILFGLGISLASIAIMAVFGSLILRGILGPLRKMMAVLSAVAHGDFTHNLRVDSEDEIGTMATSLNQAVNAMRTALQSIEQSAVQLASAAEELSTNASQTAQSARIQQDQTSQVSTAMREMSSAVQQVADHSQRAAQTATQTNERARDGGTVVEQVLERMRSIADSVSASSETMQQLGKSSGDPARGPAGSHPLPRRALIPSPATAGEGQLSFRPPLRRSAF